jgi:hypothetical protein
MSPYECARRVRPRGGGARRPVEQRALTGLLRPDRSELLVAGAEFALDALADHIIDQASRPESLLAAGIRWTTKIVLFPVRFLFTAETGQEGTNHAAVTHYLARWPAG